MVMKNLREGEKMARYICTNCGTFIARSALSDPFLCRDCEKMLEGSEFEGRYAYLENL